MPSGASGISTCERSTRARESCHSNVAPASPARPSAPIASSPLADQRLEPLQRFLCGGLVHQIPLAGFQLRPAADAGLIAACASSNIFASCEQSG